jgi:hypothetical protein
VLFNVAVKSEKSARLVRRPVNSHYAECKKIIKHRERKNRTHPYALFFNSHGMLSVQNLSRPANAKIIRRNLIKMQRVQKIISFQAKSESFAMLLQLQRLNLFTATMNRE